MKIGTVKELLNNEFRVGLTVNLVNDLVKNGHEVYIESNAGIGSGITNQDYINSGAVIVDSAKMVWENVDLLIKVKAPIKEEFKYLKEGLILFCYLHLAAYKELADVLIKNKVTAISFETIETDSGLLPGLKPMSSLAGKMSAVLGAEYLQKHKGGEGILVGGLPGVRRAKAVIVGAGNVGVSALEILVGLGASVTILDVNVEKLAELEFVYQNKIETLYSDDINVERALSSADLVIGAVSIPGDKTPKLIKREYYKNMNEGSVIVDVAIDQGGSTEVSKATTHENPTFEVEGVIHYCVPNIPGIVPKTSTLALNNAIKPYLILIANEGLDEAIANNSALSKGINIHKGLIVNKAVNNALK